MDNTRTTRDAKVNAIVDEILDEDRDGDFNATRSETCPDGCDQSDDAPKETPSRQCKCAVENSSRFSLRVMEAMRALQRDVDRPSTSTAEEIVDYIKTNYRSNGDLYAQVRTALRQVCSQGFVMELLTNEYHLLGPVVSPTNKRGCSYDCEARPLSAREDTTRRRHDRTIDSRNENDLCRCGCAPPREEILERTHDRPDDFATGIPIFHSTRISDNERDDNADRREVSSRLCNCPITLDTRDDRRRRTASPIAGPSGTFLRTPPPAKRTRPEDQRELIDDTRASTEEEDLDCTCDADVVEVTREEQQPLRRLPRDPIPRRRNQRNGYPPREEAEEDEEVDAGAEENAEEVGKKEDDDGDEDEEVSEDSAYRELRRRGPRRRSKARERELKRWIRRCRRECERRRWR